MVSHTRALRDSARVKEKECTYKRGLTWRLEERSDTGRGSNREREDEEGWQRARGRRRSRFSDKTLVTLFVVNLPELTTTSWLQGFFRQWGQVVDSFIPQKKDAAGRTFAFVQMGSGCQAQKAIKEANGTVKEGRRLQVNPAHFQTGAQTKDSTRKFPNFQWSQ